jgi:hypothetical protein
MNGSDHKLAALLNTNREQARSHSWPCSNVGASLLAKASVQAINLSAQLEATHLPRQIIRQPL